MPISRYDLENRSIPHAVRRAAERFGDEAAVIDGDARWSYRELAGQMTRSVRAAIALGVRPGDRVGLCGPNSAGWVAAALGVLGAGGIIVPLNTRFKAGELAFVLRNSQAGAVFAAGSFLGTDYLAGLRAADPELPALERMVVLPGGEGSSAPALDWEEYLRRGGSVPEAEAGAAIDRLGPDDLSDIMFTSGTTGSPKGVQLTHGQTLRAYGWMAEEYTIRRGDRYLVIPPFFHCFGYKAGWLASFLHGVAMIPLPVFDVERAMQLIEEERVSVLMGPPTILRDILLHPRRSAYDLSSLRVSMTGGTSIPESLIHALRNEVGFEVVLSAYGLTEASALVTSTLIGDSAETVARTAGRPIPGVEVRLVDEDSGEDCPAGSPGEILVRGFTVTRGYWNDPEATAAVLDPDGWLHTGDVGVLDKDGNLSIVDRKKEMFIVGGFNAYPAEIENMLLACPDIQQVAVIGVPDERMGEVGCAYVVPPPGRSPVEAEVVGWARERMANFKVPRHVRFVEALPRNASQKILKHELRARFRPGGA